MFWYARVGIYYSISRNPLCNKTNNFIISILNEKFFEKKGTSWKISDIGYLIPQPSKDIQFFDFYDNAINHSLCHEK